MSYKLNHGHYNLFCDLFIFQAVKLSAQASAAATDLGSKVNEKVVKPTQDKVKEGKIVEDITTSMSSWAAKVC